MANAGAPTLEQLYEHGDAYEALETCQQLDMLLSRLRRRRFLDDREWAEGRQELAQIRERIEGHLALHA